MNLEELDGLMTSHEMPVRPETLAEAWDMTEIGEPVRQVIVLVTMRARPGRESELEAAAREFVRATLQLPGALGSTLHRSPTDSLTWYLLERFKGEESFGRHMASDYFASFQLVQSTLLAEPVTAVFLSREIIR